MGKIFDRFKKYSADEDFYDDFYEESKKEEIDEAENIPDEEYETSEDIEEEQFDELEDIEETEGEEEQFEELEDIEETDGEEEQFDELEDIEEIDGEEEQFEELEDIEDSDCEEDYFEKTEEAADCNPGVHKPTSAELIAAFYQEDEYPKKRKNKGNAKQAKEEKKMGSEIPSYQEENDYVITRRRERRKRKIRNVILAYVITLAVLAGLVAGGYYGIRILVDNFLPAVNTSTEDENPVDEVLSELNESEEEIVIEAPAIMDENPEAIEEDYLEEIVEACISAMPLEDKVAQLFIVTPESLTGVGKVVQAGEKTQEVLNQYRIGGFIYSDDNLIDKEQVMNMLSATSGYNLYDMFLAIDEGGGTASAVQKSGIVVPEVGSMAEIGADGDVSKAYEAGHTIGQYLRELGFNVDFAPAADVVTVTENSPIGDRSFGSDPAMVGQMAQKCAEGIQESGVSACLKHFPGLGDTTTDTHKERTVIEKSLEELQATNYVAFQDAIEAGVDFIMVSHATATAIDEVYPCSLSKKVITEQLRDYLGYDGIVVTDAMNVKSITDYYTTEEACVRTIKAGADMILMPENFETGYNAVLEAVREGEISEERIDESLKRIFRVKKRDEIVQ